MLLNYLKLALRLLARNPFFTFINVVGLSVGFAVFFILWPFSQSELKSDHFIKDHDQIARILMDWRWRDNEQESWGQLYIPFAATYISSELKNHEQIVDATRCVAQGSFSPGYTPNLKPEIVVSIEQSGQLQIRLKVENSICADENFFEFFDLPFSSGDRSTALKISESVVLSESMVSKLFGDENPLGKTLNVDGSTFQVTGVFQDLPRNTHLLFDMVFSNSGKLSTWNSITLNGPWCRHYYKMKGDVSQLAVILNENKDRLIGNYLNANQHIKIDFLAQPLNEIVYSENLPGDDFKGKSKFTLNVLAGVSLVVLMMAWMNYVNLTISRTKTRFKEIAARKVSGALMSDLFLQFICQSAVINVLAALIGVTIIQLVRQPVDLFFNIRVIPFSELGPGTALFFSGIMLTGILFTALYPAWITLQHNTRQLLSGAIPNRKRILTSVLTTFQYVAALTLIAWIFVMYNQLNFILNKDLGIDKENVVVLNAPIIGLEENGKDKMVGFASQLKSNFNVDEIALSGRVCGDWTFNQNVRLVGKQVYYGIDSHGGVDENFIPMYKIKMLAGRNFLRDEKKQSIILSRLASERLGFKSPEEAIGALVEFRVVDIWKTLEVIGVVADYRVEPYYISQNSTEDVTGRGQCFTYLNNVWTTAVPQRVSVRLTADQIQSFLEKAEQLFNQTFPGNIFNWYFLDAHIIRQYGVQKIIRNQISFFTVLAVGVACLGLLGMISVKVVEKTKEISVRRILGAEVVQVTGLLLSSTFRQVCVAVMIGVPTAWKFSQQYLTQYTEQIELQWWHFTLPIAILVVIMLVTISSVLWRAARTNPVEALKYE